MLGHQSLQLTDDGMVAAECERTVDSLGHRLQAKLIEALRLVSRERLEYHVCERRTSPECERSLEPIECADRVAVFRELACALDVGDEPPRIDVLRRDGELVAWRAGDDRLVTQGRAELRDVRLQRLDGGRRRQLAPELVDESLTRQYLAGVQKEGGEQRPLLCSRDGDRPRRAVDLQRPEDPELHP